MPATATAETPAATPPVNQEDELVAAVMAGIEQPAAETPVAETPAAETPAVETPAETPATETPAETPAATPAAETPATADTPAATPPATPATDAPAKKPSDEFGELPQDAKAETRERFGKLKSALDNEADRREQAEAVARQWTETIASTGATPQQFGGALQYLADVNSGTPEGLQRAYDAMAGELAVLAKALGKPLPGIHDPLADHPDLRDDIAEERITPERAVELAQARARDKLSAASRQVQQQRTASTSEQQAAVSAITQFRAEQRAANPAGYDAKMKIMAPLVQRMTARLPPSEWLGEIKALYASIELPAPVAAAPATGKAPDSIRPGGSAAAGGQIAKEAASPLEAVLAALPNIK